MIALLPHWVEYGAFLLALLAGVVNVVGFLGFSHQAVSHLSGSASQLGIAIALLDSDFLQLALVLCSFLAGAAISGFLIDSPALEMGRHYSVALALEAILIAVAIPLLQHGNQLGTYLTSAACGLQNALVTSYSGAIVRTTHVTGIFTDLGLMLGSRLRGTPLDRRKALLLVLIIAGFILGGTLGYWSFAGFGFLSLLLPVALALLLALAYQRLRVSEEAAGR